MSLNYQNEINKGFVSKPADLSELKIIDAKSVVKLVENINSSSNEDSGDKNLVICIATGGTISMKQDGAVRVPDLEFQEIFKYTNPLLQERFIVKGLNAFHIDSSQMNYSHTRELAIAMTYIYKHIQIPFIGFLILHGTDTMAYSGATMSLMTGHGLPFSVVYTGAQKPIQEIMSDAGANISNSLFTLEELYKNNMAEVVIVMGNNAVLANGAMKIDNKGVDAFDSPRHSYVAQFDKLSYPLKISEHLQEKGKENFKPDIWYGDYSHTLVVNSALGLNPEIIEDQVMSKNVRAVILYTYGASTAEDNVVSAISKCIKKKNIPAFVVNPINGDVDESLYPSGHMMKMQGLHSLMMTLPAALAKIEIALRKYPENVDKIIEFMVNNYVGETPVSYN